MEKDWLPEYNLQYRVKPVRKNKGFKESCRKIQELVPQKWISCLKRCQTNFREWQKELKLSKIMLILGGER